MSLTEVADMVRHLRARDVAAVVGKLVGVALFFALVHSYFGPLIDAYAGR